MLMFTRKCINAYYVKNSQFLIQSFMFPTQITRERTKEI